MLKRRKRDLFLLTWTLAVFASVSAFVVHLALRGRTLELGYELGRARAEQSKLREVKRVLELESASYKTPARVDMVARTLLGMEQATSDRIVTINSTRADARNSRAVTLSVKKEEPR